ncbi:hypothetical protein Ocin01_04090 [Orchesella cincta]|uniref:Uncharacterized protein n=1 Tax=Orchesella cincta TaxID=48709 RepID=A0A1D2NBF5_ORCCI|nr:hypothetical protein Ocin01_04090 [Orchesella cincta]
MRMGECRGRRDHNLTMKSFPKRREFSEKCDISFWREKKGKSEMGKKEKKYEEVLNREKNREARCLVTYTTRQEKKRLLLNTKSCQEIRYMIVTTDFGVTLLFVPWPQTTSHSTIMKLMKII